MERWDRVAGVATARETAPADADALGTYLKRSRPGDPLVERLAKPVK